MKLVLDQLKKLTKRNVSAKPDNNEKLYKVLYCGVCRTDAKMFFEGQKDLVLPRVLGHEIVVQDENTANQYVIWPGNSCGHCEYCSSGRENLCESIKIRGFHFDGGFQDYLSVNQNQLIPLPKGLDAQIAVLAEPAGCVINALSDLNLIEPKDIIIYGGGTLGLITAIIAHTKGLRPIIIEKNEEKIHHIKKITQHLTIECLKETQSSNYDMAINTCSDYIAFAQCITKLKKGGMLCYFSGITKNEQISTNLLNLIHYKELKVNGYYGLTKQHMQEAVNILHSQSLLFSLLIEQKISIDHLSQIMTKVMEGKGLKYVVDLQAEAIDLPDSLANPAEKHNNIEFEKARATTFPNFPDLLNQITPVNESILPKAQYKIDNKTKPLGSLGKLESLAVQISGIQNSLNPVINHKSLFVFAGDHGITEEGVSAFPPEVTCQMVKNFLEGNAAINVLCRQYAIGMSIIDIGVNGDLSQYPGNLINKKVSKGTRNFAIQPAMTKNEAIKALEKGMEVFFEHYQKQKLDILGLGEMGIGNTSSASAIISGVTGIPVEKVTGRGTGVDNKGLEHKFKVLKKALALHTPNPRDGIDILMKVGGFEIAGIAGAALAAASQNVTIVLDGIISTAAGLIAYLINPRIKDYFVVGHKSVETGQIAALEMMQLQPILDLNMRLGEGTGAALTINLCEAACRIMREMASFDDAGVSQKNSP
ncbi:MAG: nicotinate-nucleotide--dimethylbenzimidazole phosphoribosyltransferase [Spirochaetes bacterium]|nr:nicotinate-nucleotide--dimethylbenzimidazole phosphoribosyltransferase [Spirochaetota bacterium]